MRKRIARQTDGGVNELHGHSARSVRCTGPDGFGQRTFLKGKMRDKTLKENDFTDY